MTVDIDQMIATLPRDEQVLVKRLRALVTECIPQATEKAYDGLSMPFYSRNRLICYILPPSVSFDPTIYLSEEKQGQARNEKQKEKGVLLGFNQGKSMSNEEGLLLAEGRKQTYVMYFKKLNDINEKQVRALLFEAAMIDDQFTK